MSFLLSFSWDICCSTFLINASVSLLLTLSLVFNSIVVIGGQFSKLWQQILFFLGGKVIRQNCFSLTAPARISLLQSWTKVLWTLLQYSYYSVISRFPLKTVQRLPNFLAVLLPPPYTKLDTRVQHCLWVEGRGWIYVQDWKTPQKCKSVPRLLSTTV